MLNLSISFSDLLLVPAAVLSAMYGSYFAILRKGSISKLVGLLFLFLAGFLLLNLAATFNYPPIVFFLLMRVSILIPATLWLITLQLFSDEEQATWRFWALTLSYFVLECFGTGLGLWTDIEVENSTLLNVSTVIYPQLVMIGLAVHSLFLAWRGYKSDLIEARRVARVVFVVCVAILILLVLGNGILLSLGNLLLGRDSFTQGIFPDALIASYILALMFGFHLFTFTLRDDVGLLVDSSSTAETDQPDAKEADQESSADKELAEKIISIMRSEKLYREEKYTITQFAGHVRVPEHKLRQIINKQLQHRNFNQFLNGFRVSEATENLESSDTPISSIAYEVGFSTLSVFNRAFKEVTGVTPKEYRNSRPADKTSTSGAEL